MRDGEDVRAFHNICRHRGNKLVWNDFPREETSGTARQFVCKYHGWRYGLDGACTFAQQEGEFFDLDKADYGLVPVHCDTFAGFIFVNFAAEPSQSLREYLGPMLLGIEDYPFGEMTDRYAFKVECRANWKVFADAFLEFYHAPVVHVGQHPVRPAGDDQPERATRRRTTSSTARTGSSHGGVPAPRLGDAAGERQAGRYRHPQRVVRPVGPFGAGGAAAGINPGKIHPWGLSSFQFFPNFAVLIWESGWYNTHQFWPTSHNSLLFEGNVYSLPAKSASDRVGREMAAVSFKEYSLQDANTLEATQLGIEAGVIDRWPLNDQEVLVRHFHHGAKEWVRNYQQEKV